MGRLKLIGGMRRLMWRVMCIWMLMRVKLNV
jgi:hypothetical protein